MVIDKAKKSAILRLMTEEQSKISSGELAFQRAQAKARELIMYPNTQAHQEVASVKIQIVTQPALGTEISSAELPTSLQEQPVARQDSIISPSRSRAASQPEIMRVSSTA